MESTPGFQCKQFFRDCIKKSFDVHGKGGNICLENLLLEGKTCQEVFSCQRLCHNYFLRVYLDIPDATKPQNCFL